MATVSYTQAFESIVGDAVRMHKTPLEAICSPEVYDALLKEQQNLARKRGQKVPIKVESISTQFGVFPLRVQKKAARPQCLEDSLSLAISFSL